METWYVTWRHINKKPTEASTRYAETKEEAEKLQEKLLKFHAEDYCYTCSKITAAVEDWEYFQYIKGDNEKIVTRVRTRQEIIDTVYAERNKPENRVCYHPVTYCTHPSHQEEK